MDKPYPEAVAQELRRLVKLGLNPKHLPFMTALRSVVPGVSERDSVSAAGNRIRRYTIQTIYRLCDIEFHGVEVYASRLHRALLVLLKVEGTGQGTVNRRLRAIQALGVTYTEGTWRRNYGPEWDLLMLLAEELCRDTAN